MFRFVDIFYLPSSLLSLVCTLGRNILCYIIGDVSVSVDDIDHEECGKSVIMYRAISRHADNETRNFAISYIVPVIPLFPSY